jgi:hypothetical protein
MFKYACLGHKTDDYFDEKQSRPDETLGGIRDWERKDFSAIIFGYLYEAREIGLMEDTAG